MVEHKIEANAIEKAIDESRRILLIAHKKPDGDTLGSVCAWMHLLRGKEKHVTAFCIDVPPPNLSHLPGSHEVVQDVAHLSDDYDLIIVNDSGDLEYAGVDEYLRDRDTKKTRMINIDHHSTNPYYGDINLVIPTASSNTEIIARLFLYWNEEITKPIADCLLNGIITDTDSLKNPATNYQSMVIASELVRAGADLHGIVQRSLFSRSITELKLFGLALSRIKRNYTYGIIASYLTHEDLSQYGEDVRPVEGIANYMTLIPDVNIVLFLTQLDGEHVKGSMRSIKDTVDVGSLAARIGGGGHQKASGFKIKGRINTRGTDWTIL